MLIISKTIHKTLFFVYKWDGITVEDTGSLTGTVDAKITKLNLTARGNKVYGGYDLDYFDDFGNPLHETGSLSGTLTLLPSAKFSMTAVSEDKRHRVTLTGTAK